MFWSVKFALVDNLNRHPSQIYEAIFEGLILFIILNYFVSKNNKKMDIFLRFFDLIFLFRSLLNLLENPIFIWVYYYSTYQWDN